MAAGTIEDRLRSLEEEVAYLKSQMQELVNPNGDWVQRISGSMKDIPAPVFEGFKKLCEEIRQADRPADEDT